MIDRSSQPPPPAPGPLLRRLAVVSHPPWLRLLLAFGLGATAAVTTVGLLAGSGALLGRAAFRPGLGAIAGLLAAVEVLAVVRAPLRYAERLVGHDAAFTTLTRWRVWLYDRLEPLSPAGLRAWRSGDLLWRGISDVDTLQDLWLRATIPVGVAVVAGATGITVVGLLVPWAAAAVGGALVVGLALSWLLGRRAQRTATEEAELRGELSAQVTDLLGGAPELLAFGEAPGYVATIEAMGERLEQLARRRANLTGLTAAVVIGCLGAAVLGTLVLGVQAVHDHRLSAADLAILPLAAIGAFDAVPAVALAAMRLGDVMAAGQRLLALEAIPVPVRDPDQPAPAPDGRPTVTMAGARLRYGPDRPWALDGLDLDLTPGARLAVVGPSGAGKSSIVNVLLRFWPLDEGVAALDGTPLESFAQSDVRATMGLLAQEADLFAGTIRSNIVFARPDATEAEIGAAMSLAQLDPWVASLPAGLDTPVGERGTQLSGGQRQRVALARTLLAGRAVLILDEPTAGLDQQSGDQLVADLVAAAGDRSVLLVTHRPSELAYVDQVAVVDQGRVVALRGAPEGPSR